MRAKNFACRLICVVLAIGLVACVDKSFNLDDVSKEVTVGSETTVLPLGYIENKSIADLLGGQEFDGLVIDDSGNLSYNYVGQSSKVSIEGVNTEFEIPKIESSFTAEYPKFDLDMDAIEINEEGDITISGLEQYAYGDFGFYIPEGIALPTVHGKYTAEFGGDDLSFGVDVPEQISNINKIHFRDIDGEHHGAPMRLSVAFNDLAGINGGGSLKFDLTVEGGTFRILDAENNLICDGNHYSETYLIAAGAESVDFVIYIESLTNTNEVGGNQHLDIPITLVYDMEFDMNVKAGYFELDTMPHIALSADFEYGDAEVAVDSTVNIIDCDVSGGTKINIAGLPDELKMVRRVGMKQNDGAKMRFYARGLDWLGDLAKDVGVSVLLPDYLKLYFVAGENYSYNAATGELSTTIAELDKGVAIGIEALDFGSAGISPDADGTISLDFTPHVTAHFIDGSHVNVSSLMRDGDIEICVGIEQVKLSVESISGVVDYTYELNEQFALSGLEDLDVEIGGVGLKPVIEVNVTHPLTLKTAMSCEITPCVDGVAMVDNAISLKDLVVPEATYENGDVKPVTVSLIIADESRREEYADPKYTFVACDVTKLLNGRLPDAVDINLSFGVDASEVQTLYVPDQFYVAYDYKVMIPFDIDGSLELRYNAAVGDLNSIFEAIAGYDIEVGDVALLATVVNTTPFELAADVALLDVDGNPTEAQVHIAEGAKIHGSSDGVTPAESVVRLDLDFGKDGKVSNISNVDGLQFELVATSAANETSVALNKNQYIGVSLQIELAGGITIDLDKLQ